MGIGRNRTGNCRIQFYKLTISPHRSFFVCKKNSKHIILKCVTVQIFQNDNKKNRNLIQDEIERRVNSVNACYHSVQNLTCSRLLSKIVKIGIYTTIILLVVQYGCETWSLTLWEGHRLRVFEENIWAEER
jgi:hypothetical protein